MKMELISMKSIVQDADRKISSTDEGSRPYKDRQQNSAGMGGSGKTTLVATTYNSQVVMPHFDS
ncbi:hypothetical protein SADUNF_Sadunf15G0102300 [Salix dunnii]|uniref:Uncharacterized protein n=1 Tax=Salix dunnii TaxID=1413687 RepID=A0A835MLE8_9ROSI|nr:hypothetical protein SADUNF_Sadunf15G0102300 [Salix dunnii]